MINHVNRFKGIAPSVSSATPRYVTKKLARRRTLLILEMEQ
jgi:hypothetical protein